MGRPSIDPELMIRMLIVGYIFAIRSERLICREVQVNLAYRWSAVSRMLSRTIQRSRVPGTSVFARGMFFAACLSVSSKRALRPVWLVAKALQSMRA
jgi:transposase